MTKYFLKSPCYGRIVKCNENEIGIFIPYKENHNIFSIIDGLIKSITFEDGKFVKDVFGVKHTKGGKATITITNNDLSVKYSAFVGLPYRVRRIRFYNKKGDRVNKSKRIARILYGSFCEIYLFKKYNINPLVKIGDKVVGGKTNIGFIIKWLRWKIWEILEKV